MVTSTASLRVLVNDVNSFIARIKLNPHSLSVTHFTPPYMEAHVLSLICLGSRSQLFEQAIDSVVLQKHENNTSQYLVLTVTKFCLHLLHKGDKLLL